MHMKYSSLFSSLRTQTWSRVFTSDFQASFTSILFALCWPCAYSYTVFAPLSQTHPSFPRCLTLCVWILRKASVSPLAYNVLSLACLNFCSGPQFHSSGFLHSFAFLFPHHPCKTVSVLEGTYLPYSSLRSPTRTCIHVKRHAHDSSKSINNHQGSEVWQNNWPLYKTV